MEKESLFKRIIDRIKKTFGFFWDPSIGQNDISAAEAYSKADPSIESAFREANNNNANKAKLLNREDKKPFDEELHFDVDPTIPHTSSGKTREYSEGNEIER